MVGEWKNTGVGRAIYTQTIPEGFIMTQGTEPFSLKDNPFDIPPHPPIFQLLKVHEGYPMVFKEGDRMSVRPAGEKRLIGQILKDKNPKVYDTVSLILAPWIVDFEGSHEGLENIGKLEEFITSDARRYDASLIYIDREIPVDGQYSSTFSLVPPSQIFRHIVHWIHSNKKVQGYNEDGNRWETVGRFDIQNDGGLTLKLVRKLEERFGTKMLAEEIRD